MPTTSLDHEKIVGTLRFAHPTAAARPHIRFKRPRKFRLKLCN
jgi:hypothetical protein